MSDQRAGLCALLDQILAVSARQVRADQIRMGDVVWKDGRGFYSVGLTARTLDGDVVLPLGVCGREQTYAPDEPILRLLTAREQEQAA